MYCCQIWSQYRTGTVRKLQVGYNHAFRRIIKYDRTCSASGMFVANNVMSFNEIWRKSLYNFKQRVTKSNNIIVNHVCIQFYQSHLNNLEELWSYIVYCVNMLL